MPTPSESELYAKRKALAHNYYLAHREEIKARSKAYKKSSPDAKEKARLYRVATRDKAKEYQRQNYLLHQEYKKTKAREYYIANKQACLQKAREYRLKNTANRRNYMLKTNYGITSEQWNMMFSAQGKCCAICKSDHSNKQQWHTDHCHVSGRVRGILCHMCNTMLGAAKDRIEVLRSAINYLKIV